MNSRTLLRLFAIALLLLTAATGWADQRHMDAAIELLQAAKTANKPLPMLTAAKDRLQKAKKNKGGERKEAIPILNEAIAEARVGDKEKMIAKINHVIAKIHAGKSKAN